MYLEIAVGLFILGTYVYHRWIEDHPTTPRPFGFSAPRVEQGTPLPIIYGRCRVRSPVVVWSGNYFVPGDSYTPWGAPGPRAIDHYSVDLIMVLGIPFYQTPPPLVSAVESTTLLRVFAGDAPVEANIVSAGAPGMQRFSGPTAAINHSDTLTIAGAFSGGRSDTDLGNINSAPFAVGVPSVGWFPDRVVYLASSVDGNTAHSAMSQAGVPFESTAEYRNQASAYMHVGLGPSSAIPGFSFEVVSLSTGTPSDMGQSLADDADPAAVIFDLLTSPWGKLGMPASAIDLPSFQAASATLYSEGHGYSRAIEQYEDASVTIGDVLRQTDGLIYQEPTTGKIVYVLVRNDYNVPDLKDINPSNVIRDNGVAKLNYAVNGWAETINQVRLSWTDRRANYANGLAIGQNAANAVGQGGRLRSVNIQFPGCCDAALAQRLASRELAVVSRPIVKATVTVNRTFYEHRPGGVVTFTWPELGIDHMVMRIARIDLGQLHDGRIVLDLIRDVFDVSVGAFPVP